MARAHKKCVRRLAERYMRVVFVVDKRNGFFHQNIVGFNGKNLASAFYRADNFIQPVLNIHNNFNLFKLQNRLYNAPEHKHHSVGVGRKGFDYHNRGFGNRAFHRRNGNVHSFYNVGKIFFQNTARTVKIVRLHCGYNRVGIYGWFAVYACAVQNIVDNAVVAHNRLLRQHLIALFIRAEKFVRASENSAYADCYGKSRLRAEICKNVV